MGLERPKHPAAVSGIIIRLGLLALATGILAYFLAGETFGMVGLVSVASLMGIITVGVIIQQIRLRRSLGKTLP
jgi:hypothetical protein